MNIACIQKNIDLYLKLKTEFTNSQVINFNSFFSPKSIKNFDLIVIEHELFDINIYNEFVSKNNVILPFILVIYNDIKEISSLIENVSCLNISFLQFDSIKQSKIEILLKTKKNESSTVLRESKELDYLYDITSLKEIISYFFNENYKIKNHLEWISQFINAKEVFLLKKDDLGFLLSEKHTSSKEEKNVDFFIPLKSDIYSLLQSHQTGCVLINENNESSLDKFLKTMDFEGCIFLKSSEEDEYIILFSIPKILGKKLNEKDLIFIKELSIILMNFKIRLSNNHIITSKCEDKVIEEKINDSKKSENINYDGYSNKYLKEMASRTSNDFKNALVSIKTFTQLFPEKYKDASFRKDFFKVITHEVSRLEGLMNTIGFFSSECILQCKTVHLNDIINTSFSKINELFSDLKLTNESENLPLKLFCDEKLMVKTFQSIFMNSAEAMNGSGIIYVKMQPNEKKHFSYITILIEDKGRGIEEKDLSNIFDPFFSTKPNGLGLGLTMVKKIIDSHNGDIKICNSLNGNGVVVKIIMPVTSRFLPINQLNQISMSDN